MSTNVLELVKSLTSEAVANNPEVPANKTNDTIETVSQGIFNGLQQQATSGGLGQIINMFKPSGGGVSSSLSQNIESSVVNSLMDKVGIKSQTAKSIAAAIVPVVLSSISKLGKGASGNSGAGGINVQSILNSLTGGKTSGMDIQSILDKNLGGDDGKFELSDLTNMFGKGKDSHSEGGLGNIMEGLGHLLK